MPVKLTTPVPVVPLSPERAIDVHSSLLIAGSCFAACLLHCFQESGLDVQSHPHGILYNPLILNHTLARVLNGPVYGENELIEHDGVFHSFSHHHSFSATTAESALQRINEAFRPALEKKEAFSHVICTWGTAEAWFHCSRSEMSVANCHRLPARDFTRRLLSIDDIVDSTAALLQQWLVLRPDIQWILTISPVRYLKQNAFANSVSKAHLLSAAHELALCFPRSVTVFPSYEIMMDELRDYRFYDRDLCHPNEVAQDIIRDRFTATCLTSRAQSFIRDMEPIRRAMNHRPRAQSSPEQHAFIEQMLRRIQQVEQTYSTALPQVRAHFSPST
ncbi:MAG: hypothetical protein EOL87_10255 [Spartobacteria bacterium]|nr:hypothetical protein [Spartobacteria bacterium]